MAFKLSLFSSLSALHLSKSVIKAMPPPVGALADSNQSKTCSHRGSSPPAHSWVTVTNQCQSPFPVLWSSFSDQLGSLSCSPRKLIMWVVNLLKTPRCVDVVSLGSASPSHVGWGVHPVSSEWLQCWPSCPLAVSQCLSESSFQNHNLCPILWFWGLGSTDYIPPLPLLRPLGSRNSCGLQESEGASFWTTNCFHQLSFSTNSSPCSSR